MFYKMFIQPAQNQNQELLHLDNNLFGVLVNLSIISAIMCSSYKYFNFSKTIMNFSEIIMKMFVTTVKQFIINMPWIETISIILTIVLGSFMFLLLKEIDEILFVEWKNKLDKKNDKIKELEEVIDAKDAVIKSLMNKKYGINLTN